MRPGLFSVFSDLGRDNAAWFLPALSVAGVTATFMIGGVWWGIGGVFFVLALTIVALANTLVRAKADANKAFASREADAAEEHAPEIALQGAESAQNTQAQTSVEPKEAHEESGLNAALTAAFQNHDAKAVAAALDGWIQEADTADERVTREAVKYSLQVSAGSNDALSLLRSLADANPKLADPVLQLSRALAGLGEVRAAAEELARRRHTEPQLEIPQLLLQEARLRHRLEEFTTSLDLLDAASNKDDGSNSAFIAEQRGYTLEKLGRLDHAFASFEQATELRPLDHSLRFHLAYAYSEAGFSELAVEHYFILLQGGSNPSAENNLGVDFSRLGLKLRAVTHYKRAAENGLSLAAGNLANIALTAGLASEAEEWIKKGEAGGRPDPRVTATRATLTQASDNEPKQFAAIRKRADELRSVFRKWVECEPTAAPSGTWSFSTGHTFELQAEGTVARAAHGEGEQKTEIVIRADEKGFTITLALGQYGIRKAEGRLIRGEGKLVGYLRNWPERGMTTAVTAAPAEGT